jgi:hypothetical protein
MDPVPFSDGGPAWAFRCPAHGHFPAGEEVTVTAYRIERTSLGECAVVSDMGAIDLCEDLLLFAVWLECEYREILPAMSPAERKAAWARRVKACEEEVALRRASRKRDAWNGSPKLREAMACPG